MSKAKAAWNIYEIAGIAVGLWFTAKGVLWMYNKYDETYQQFEAVQSQMANVKEEVKDVKEKVTEIDQSRRIGLPRSVLINPRCSCPVRTGDERNSR